MSKTTMTIHRGLAELKLIDSRINKKINAITPVGIHQKDKKINGHITIEEFSTTAKAELDSVTSLINRKERIKAAIVKSNATTPVKVNNKTMVVADAISFKTIIDNKKLLIDRLKRQFNSEVGSLNTKNEKVGDNLNLILNSTFGKDNVKTSTEEVEAVSKPYLETNEFHLADPLGLQTVVEGLETEVENFEVEIDAVLSESNASTQIEIED